MTKALRGQGFCAKGCCEGLRRDGDDFGWVDVDEVIVLAALEADYARDLGPD